MTVDTPTARWFSESLLHLYAAATEVEIDRAVALAQVRLQRISPEPPSNPRQAHVTACLQRIMQQAAADWRARLRRAGGPAVRPEAWQVLTRRERDVVQRIALGDTDAAIGRALGISPKTASKHVENILRKLGVETRTAAAAVACDAMGRTPSI
jgi:DNA-binding CsgD family transcriptional regulator